MYFKLSQTMKWLRRSVRERIIETTLTEVNFLEKYLFSMWELNH